MFPDRAPPNCEVTSDMPLHYLMFITVLFFFPSVTIVELLAVDKNLRTRGDLTRLQKDMDRFGAAIPLVQVILGLWLTYALYMHGDNLAKVMAQGLAHLLFPLFCNGRYCILSE